MRNKICLIAENKTQKQNKTKHKKQTKNKKRKNRLNIADIILLGEWPKIREKTIYVNIYVLVALKQNSVCVS